MPQELRQIEQVSARPKVVPSERVPESVEADPHTRDAEFFSEELQISK